eukprot:3743890-Heterocapsa_arctica.AAC.1
MDRKGYADMAYNALNSFDLAGVPTGGPALTEWLSQGYAPSQEVERPQPGHKGKGLGPDIDGSGFRQPRAKADPGKGSAWGASRN